MALPLSLTWVGYLPIICLTFSIDFDIEAFISCSFILITFHPCRRNTLVTLLSLAIFVSIFFFQKLLWVFDNLLHLQPCQKHPSTKTATFLSSKTKSGFPAKSFAFILHPEIFADAKPARNRLSVERVFLLWIAAMICERFSSENLSAISLSYP